MTADCSITNLQIIFHFSTRGLQTAVPCHSCFLFFQTCCITEWVSDGLQLPILTVTNTFSTLKINTVSYTSRHTAHLVDQTPQFLVHLAHVQALTSGPLLYVFCFFFCPHFQSCNCQRPLLQQKFPSY